MPRIRALHIFFALVPALYSGTTLAQAPRARAVVSDSAFAAHHPRLLFDDSTLPALRTKVIDGGYDDAAYTAIRGYATGIYASYPAISQLGAWYGVETFPNLGIAGWIPQPIDSSTLNIGRLLTHVLVSNYAPDFDEAGSGMRLRALALGYDMFFATAPDSERAVVRAEMEAYIDLMTTSLAYRLFEYPPYLANHSAMFGAALGLAAIALDGETDPARVQAALDMADRIADGLFLELFDEFGAYGEGGFYALWTMRNLVYYFEARERFDGTSWAGRPRVRALEQWLAYELLPEGSAKSMNINDSAIYSRPFALVPTYFAWATSRWNSGLSAWLYERVAGLMGHEFGEQADQGGRVLWWRPVSEIPPSSIVPERRVFPDAGLYAFRTGWPSGASSDDVVFAFHCGKFRGGHAQEDQGQFVLHGYGTHFVVDHGPGNTVAKQSEAHNIVLIDGAGQHNAGSSIGTDGRITAYIEGGLGDYVRSDASDAYSTHSHYNDPNRPVEGVDWSWGYSGANPVREATRRIVSVYDGTHTPYFIVLDTIDKDGSAHAFSWRLHTADLNAVTTSAWPLDIRSSKGVMAVHLIEPDTSQVTITTAPFDNATPEENSTVISVDQNTARARFGVLLAPSPAAIPRPGVQVAAYPWGEGITVDFGDSTSDRIALARPGSTVSWNGLATDGEITVVRTTPTSPPTYLAVGATRLDIDGVRHLDSPGIPVSVSLRSDTLSVDSPAPTWKVLDTGVSAVRYRTMMLPFFVDNGYVVRSTATGAVDTPAPATRMRVTAWPNPANPGVNLTVDLPTSNARVVVTVFNVHGQRVRRIRQQPYAGRANIRWNGLDDAGLPVASGVYFVRARADRFVAHTRVVIVR